MKLSDYEYYKDDWVKIYCGANKTIIPLLKQKSVDLIVTDPPYSYEFIKTFSDLSKFGKEILKPEKFLACYSGQYHLPEVLNRLSENLIYRWTIALVHVRNTFLISGRISNRWKPVILMQNGGEKRGGKYAKERKQEIFQDVIKSSGVEKDFHKWGQSIGGVISLVLQFSKENELVLDPFLGGGTTCVVSKMYCRKSIGIEKDEDACKIAMERIHDVFKMHNGCTLKSGKIRSKGLI